jgi:hypothetical protein
MVANVWTIKYTIIWVGTLTGISDSCKYLLKICGFETFTTSFGNQKFFSRSLAKLIFSSFGLKNFFFEHIYFISCPCGLGLQLLFSKLRLMCSKSPGQ